LHFYHNFKNMELQVLIKVNEKLYLRNPAESELGRKIVHHSVELIHTIGFESFTFKKLAEDIGTTEAGIYRYFSNKHRLLMYLVNWYWSWLEYQLMFAINNLTDPELKLRRIIHLLVSEDTKDLGNDLMNRKKLYEIVNVEGVKSYLTKKVYEDNKAKLFKPYKDLCARIAEIIKEVNPRYRYPRSLSSTLLEMAHFQKFFMQHLPSLTDFGGKHDSKNVESFLENMLMSCLKR
jgi:AcrR family transcriptional regulator